LLLPYPVPLLQLCDGNQSANRKFLKLKAPSNMETAKSRQMAEFFTTCFSEGL
jgi:hypothetical protein